MGAQLMVEVVDFAPAGLNAAHWRTLMVVSRIANDATRTVTLEELANGGLQRLIGAESAGGAAKRVNALLEHRLLHRVVPQDLDNLGPAYRVPRYDLGEHLSTREISSEPTALYRLFDCGESLLYVGITGDTRVRFEQHAFDKPWWPLVARVEVHWYDSRAEAATEEGRLIQCERPPHNKIATPTPRRQRVAP